MNLYCNIFIPDFYNSSKINNQTLQNYLKEDFNKCYYAGQAEVRFDS